MVIEQIRHDLSCTSPCSIPFMGAFLAGLLSLFENSSLLLSAQTDIWLSVENVPNRNFRSLCYDVAISYNYDVVYYVDICKKHFVPIIHFKIRSSHRVP